MIRFLLFALALALVACNQPTQHIQPITTAAQAKPQPVAPQPKDTFKTGEIIALIPLRADASQSFSLYLPKQYNDSAKLPVIIFFDPHGDGTVPLKLYATLSEKNAYILVGSNSSKNGLSFDETSRIADNLLREVKNRLAVNTSKITYCGFSGGAKVALLSGSNNPDISTIIYCGAVAQVNPKHPVTLLGFAGTKDMNYTDLIAFENGLKQTQLSHYLVEWGGKHEFPTAEVFKDAFQLLNTGSIDNYSKKQGTISADKVAVEQNYKQQYIQALQQQDLTWWKKEIASLNSKKKTDPMFERLLGFVSLGCYSISNNALQQNNLEVAGKILAIYELADPGNTDCQKFTAIYKEKLQGR